jgi:hypothetical protein
LGGEGEIDAGGVSMGAGAFNQPQQGYAQQQAQVGTNGKAVAAIVFGILAVVTFVIWGALVFGPLAIVFGSIARKDIQRGSGQGGDGLALAGIILGAAGLALWAIFLTIGLVFA